MSRARQATNSNAFSGRCWTSDLDGVAEGADVMAYYEADNMWHSARLDGVYSEPETGTVYYAVTFDAVPGCEDDPVGGQQFSLYGESIRVRDSAKTEAYERKRAQQKQTVDQRIGQLDAFFKKVDQGDQDESGALGRSEVRELLRLLGAEASESQVDLIFRHYDNDHSGSVSRDEFEVCLPVLQGGYSSPAPFHGLNYEDEVTDESSLAEQEQLQEGALVAAYDPAEGFWLRAKIDFVHTAERRDGAVMQFYNVTYSTGATGLLYREALRARVSEIAELAKEQLSMYDLDGDGFLGKREVTRYLQEEGLDATDEAVDQIFQCYDYDGSGELSRDEFQKFLAVASGEEEDASKPPAGASSDLTSVVEGTQVLAFYTGEELWYGATIAGVHAGKEQMLPDGSTVTTLYYTVRYNPFPEISEVLNDSSIRMPPRKRQDYAESEFEINEEIRTLFDSVDVSHDGVLSAPEITMLLDQEGLDSSPEHVTSLFDRFDADGTGEIGRLEFEPFLRSIRRAKNGDVDPPEPPDGTSGDLTRLQVGDEVLGFYEPEGLWYPATLNGIYNTADSTYYAITYSGYNEVESVFPLCIRAKVPSSFESEVAGEAAGWMSKKCGVRSSEALRFCHLKDSFLRFYETEAMIRPRNTLNMKHVDSVGPCTAPNACSLEIELRMGAGHVAPPTRLVCTTRQDRRRWLNALDVARTPT